jgi:hypothetical protein
MMLLYVNTVVNRTFFMTENFLTKENGHEFIYHQGMSGLLGFWTLSVVWYSKGH